MHGGVVCGGRGCLGLSGGVRSVDGVDLPDRRLATFWWLSSSTSEVVLCNVVELLSHYSLLF